MKQTPRTTRGWRPVLIVVLFLAIGAVVGLLAGTKVVSPRQAAAQAKPPAPSLVTAALQRRTLNQDIVARGHAVPGSGYQLIAPDTLVGPDSVITSVSIKPGAILQEGKLVADVSGEPLVAAALPFGLYRDLNLNDTGPDVTEITHFLLRLGYVGEASDRLDTTVRRGVIDLFHDLGYPSLIPEIATTPKASAGVATPAGTDQASGNAVPQLVLKRSWIVRLDRGGRHVSTSQIRVGSVISSASTPLATLDDTPTVIRAAVDTSAAAGIAPGDLAVISNDATNSSQNGKIVRVAAGPAGDPGADDGGVSVDIAPIDSHGFTGDNSDVRVTISAKASAGAVLVAPVTGVFTDAGGQSRVTLADGVRRGPDVAIRVHECVSGWCQVEALNGTLRPGDRIVLGDTAGPGR